MLDAQELLQLQNDAYQATCDLPCVVTRATRTSRASGGGGTTWNTVATVNAGMSEPGAGTLANYQYLVGSLATWLIRFPIGTDVLEEDRLTIGGEVLTVKKDLTPRSYATLKSVLAVEVK